MRSSRTHVQVQLHFLFIQIVLELALAEQHLPPSSQIPGKLMVLFRRRVSCPMSNCQGDRPVVALATTKF